MNKKFKSLATASIATFIGLHITFLVFNYFYQWTELYWSSYLKFLYEYPLVLVFPVTLSIMLDRLSNYSSFKLDNLIVITSENQKEHFHVKANNLLFIKAAHNYVEVFFRSQQNVKKQLLRKTLKGIGGEYLSSPFLVRCHRSYLINPNNIDHIIKAGNKTVLNISG
ncbi:MAG: LytTR family transcriptional regulator DNA-binding domain-containing protein, partial [Bacteroidota bacterium]